MSDNPQQKQHTDNDRADVFAQLSDTQWRFVTAMVSNPSFSKKQAAEFININPDTVYRWPAYVDRAIELSRASIHDAAIGMRQQALLRAMAVKLKLLESDDENVRSRAATEIIEWELGKAKQVTDITSDGEKLSAPTIFLPAVNDDSTSDSD